MFDINDMVGRPGWEVKIESVKIEHPKDACVRRFREMTLFVISMLFILLVFIFCGYVLFSPKFSHDFQKWAMTIDGSIVAAFLAFLTGKNIK